MSFGLFCFEKNLWMHFLSFSDCDLILHMKCNICTMGASFIATPFFETQFGFSQCQDISFRVQERHLKSFCLFISLYAEMIGDNLSYLNVGPSDLR